MAKKLTDSDTSSHFPKWGYFYLIVYENSLSLRK